MPAESPGLMGCRGEYLLREEFSDLESDLNTEISVSSSSLFVIH